MLKRLPEMPHVRLEEINQTISNMRKQSSEGRVTTAEATVMLLKVNVFVIYPLFFLLPSPAKFSLSFPPFDVSSFISLLSFFPLFSFSFSFLGDG